MTSLLRRIADGYRILFRKTYRGMKWVVILLVALTLAEFVALDMAMFIASDIILYVELVLAGWAMSAIAFLHPALGYRVTMLGARVMGGYAGTKGTDAAGPGDELPDRSRGNR